MKYDEKLLAKKIKRKIKGDVLTDKVTRLLYSTDASIYRIIPQAVVFPKNPEDVLEIILIAQEHNIPICARGAGTGIAGESLTEGIVLDFSRYMTEIISFDPKDKTITVQPGVILDTINQIGKKYNLKLGPDPSSASRATVAGSIANNATGARSLRYGYCSDSLISAEVILADGNIIKTNDSDWKNIEKQLYKLLGAKRNIINENWPRVKRNRAGYNLKEALGENNINLLKLLAGSEGTLAVFTKLTLQLVNIPRHRVVLSANFDDLITMARAISIILEYNPSAIELMDEYVLTLAKESYPELSTILPDAKASLLIEFDSDNFNDVKHRLYSCDERLKNEFAHHVQTEKLIDKNKQLKHWDARKKAVPLLYRQHYLGKPIPTIEDTAVPVETLPLYLSELKKIFEKFGKKASYYAHAGSGELHIRPFMDLRKEEERKALSALTKEVFELTWELGGTISGEHGVGITRSWALRKQYGQAYELMIQVKDLLDPAKILNPGKIIVEETDLPLTNLRDDIRPKTEIQTHLKFDEGLFSLVDTCNGCGECKSFDPTVRMCPVFRVIRDEFSSPRGKSNFAREYLVGNLSDDDLLSPIAKSILETCLLCGSCLRECPSGGSVPKHLPELRYRRNKLGGKNRTEWFLAYSEFMEILGSKFGPISNIILANPITRKIMEYTVGLDPNRIFPKFTFPGTLNYLRKLTQKYKPHSPKYRAIWFVDLFPRFHNYELAQSIVRVCSFAGIELIIPNQRSVNMPAYAYGYLEIAKKSADYNVKNIKKHLSDVDFVLSFEPTATLCLKEEYKHLISSSDFQDISEKTKSGCELIYTLFKEGKLNFNDPAFELNLAYHCPCHLKLLNINEPGFELLKSLGLQITHLPENCCGLAGTFGMQKEKSWITELIAQPITQVIKEGNFNATISECSACRMQLEHISGLPSYHPIEILAKLI